MSTQSTTSSGPFEVAKLALVKRLLEIRAPKAISVRPLAGDFRNLVEFVADVARAIDDFAETVGHEVNVNASRSVDLRSFQAVASGAFSDAVFEIEECAAEVEDTAREASSRRFAA